MDDAEPGEDPGSQPRRPRRGPIALLTHLDRAIEWFERLVLAYGILLMAANTLINVVGRQLFGRSVYFSAELNQFLIVLVTFVGLGYAARRGRHIRMSAVYDQLGRKAQKGLMLLISVATAALMFMLAYYAFEYVSSVARRGQVTAALRVPLYMTYVWVPIGFALTGIQYLLTAVRNLYDSEVWISYSERDVYIERKARGKPGL